MASRRWPLKKYSKSFQCIIHLSEGSETWQAKKQDALARQGKILDRQFDEQKDGAVRTQQDTELSVPNKFIGCMSMNISRICLETKNFVQPLERLSWHAALGVYSGSALHLGLMRAHQSARWLVTHVFKNPRRTIKLIWKIKLSWLFTALSGNTSTLNPSLH